MVLCLASRETLSEQRALSAASETSQMVDMRPQLYLYSGLQRQRGSEREKRERGREVISTGTVADWSSHQCVGWPVVLLAVGQLCKPASGSGS